MNRHALEVLEFPKVLEQLAECCSTGLGRDFARRLTQKIDPAEIARDHDEVEEVLKSGVTVEFYQPFEPDELGGKICSPESCLGGDDFKKLRPFLAGVRNVKAKLGTCLLKGITSELNEYRELLGDLDRVFSEDGELRPDASPRLVHLKKSMNETRRVIQQELQATVKENERLLSDTNITVRGGRYVIPLKAAHRSMIKGIVHDLSTSGQTVFVEPLTTIDEQNRYAELTIEEQEEIRRILFELTESVRGRIDGIEQDIVRISRLDLIFGKARFAEQTGSHRVVLGAGRRIRIRKGRHPLLVSVCRDDREVVPLDLELDGSTSVVVISGPNAGGKTVALKTIGLLSLMNQTGLLVPADEGTMLPVFSQIFADIGDEQSIEEARSTFSAHLAVVGEAMNQAGGTSLVLLDEFLSQTSPDEGAALACALLEEFERRHALLFTTTHNEKVKMFVQTKSGMKNAGMEFNGRPTYRLVLDLPQASNALNIAAQMGIAEGLLKRAREFLDPAISSFNQLLEQLAIESSRAKSLREELAVMKSEYEDRSVRLGESARRESERMRQEFEVLVEKQRREFSILVREMKATKASKPAVKKAEAFIAASQQDLVRREPYNPAIGETVYAPRYHLQGEVQAYEDGKYLVAAEKMKMWLGPEDLEKAKTPDKKAEPVGTPVEFVPELFVRGKYRDDIFPLLERFIYDAICLNQKQVRIVHGKGQGILRRTVALYLKGVKEVKSFGPAEAGQGGDGVTVVELK